MARKITDTYPVFTITAGRDDTPRFGAHRMTPDEAREAYEEVNELLKQMDRRTRRVLDIQFEFREEATCEHCGYGWTEKSPDYNGGCCGKDEANSPERLKELRSLAEGVAGETFYRFEDEGRSRVPVDWPGALAHGVIAWLDNGRSEEAGGIAFMLRLAKRVSDGEWCTVWEDPGPPASQASLPRQPDRVLLDGRPENLANELLSLLDDMGQLPATKGAAA